MMSTDRNKDLLFIASGVILGIVFAYLIGEIAVHFIQYYGLNSQGFGTVRNRPNSTRSEPEQEHHHQQRIIRTSDALEVGIDIFSPRFLESARASQREIVRTFVEELRVEREREGLKKLGLLPLKEYNSHENMSSCNECAICLDDFEEGEVCRVLVNCSHMFHSKCVDDWLTNNQKCPNCRSDI
ncbi:hypothetical protein RND81_09G022600 [Saponaria officinalis]|uniref:RING-type domain-containing protein n=1 Tax=Saponaria officinalis TaxID=3572 RepID=A0AAW1IHS1_SAPOF